MKVYYYILLFFLPVALFSQNTALFQKANDLYNEGKYDEAVKNYEAILKAKDVSAAVYFNLANANYKLNRIAPSIYNYEKALQLAPNDSDIKTNLSFAKNMTVDVIDTLPVNAVKKTINTITNSYSYNTWAILAVVGVFCFVIIFLIYYFSYTTLLKRITFIASFVAITAIMACLTFAFHKFNLDKRNKPAIVFAQESKINAEPNNRSSEVFKLHEGTKVQILDSIKDWRKIKIANGKTGWILASDIKAL